MQGRGGDTSPLLQPIPPRWHATTQQEPTPSYRARERLSQALNPGKEAAVYITDVVWWAYTAFLVAVAAFMVFFALKVRKKGE